MHKDAIMLYTRPIGHRASTTYFYQIYSFRIWHWYNRVRVQSPTLLTEWHATMRPSAIVACHYLVGFAKSKNREFRHSGMLSYAG